MKVHKVIKQAKVQFIKLKVCKVYKAEDSDFMNLTDFINFTNLLMKIARFEDIIAWQKAHLLTVEIYREFSKCKDYSFRDQIQRAAVSIMNNIAEGFERGSNADFRRFLFMAKGSSGEVRSLLYLAFSLRYISQDKFNELSALTTEISRLISGFIKTL